MDKNIINYYRYKFYLDANHFIYIDDKPGEIHPHTWEFTIEVEQKKDEFVLFNEIKKIIEITIEHYQGKVLNEISPFDKLNPTLENIGSYFCDILEYRIEDKGWKLLRFEISESPTISYISELR